MKIVLLDSRQESIDLKFRYFDLGAPFTAALFNNHWDEETKCVRSAPGKSGCTRALESEFEHSGKWALKHIDDYIFHPYTFRHYMEAFHDNEAIQSRIPRDENDNLIEEWLDKTPQMWVSEVIIGDSYTILEV